MSGVYSGDGFLLSWFVSLLAFIYLLSLLIFLFESSLFILLSLLALLLPRMLRASRTLRGAAVTDEELGAATLLEPEKGMIDCHYLFTLNRG